MEICIYKTLLLHRSDDFIDFTLNRPPQHFATKLRPWDWIVDTNVMQHSTRFYSVRWIFV